MYRYNIEELRRAVLNGPEVHPGASIVRAETHQFLLQFADRARVAANLKVRLRMCVLFVHSVYMAIEIISMFSMTCTVIYSYTRLMLT